MEHKGIHPNEFLFEGNTGKMKIEEIFGFLKTRA